jgi:hypothetical protein
MNPGADYVQPLAQSPLAPEQRAGPVTAHRSAPGFDARKKEMRHEIKIFAVVGSLATICVTLVSLYAISKNAEWANIGIIVGIICATITVIIPVTQHILFRFKSSSDGSKEIGFNIAQKNAAQDIGKKKEDSVINATIEKEAEKLLIQIVLEQQNLFVRKSYGESATECFTWDDIDRFKQENTIAKIQRNLKEDRGCLVHRQKMMKPRRCDKNSQCQSNFQ